MTAESANQSVATLIGTMTSIACSDSPLFPPREGWGEGPGSETLVEKAAPFSTLRFYPGR